MVPWEVSDIGATSIRWICLKGAPLSFWHDQFFSFVGVKLGRLIEVSRATLNKINLLEVWLKLDIGESA